MNKGQVKQIIQEELRRRRKFLFEELKGDNKNQPQPQQNTSGVDPEPDAPLGLNPKKSHGIIAGAIKTLLNSGAVTGLDQSAVDILTKEVLKSLDIAVKAQSTAKEESEEDAETDELSDEPEYREQSEELDDQDQYDQTLDQELEDDESEENEEGDSAEEEPADDMGMDEPLFEVKKIKNIFKTK